MGVLDVFRRRGITAAATVLAADGDTTPIDVTQPFAPYTGDLVPPLMAQLDYGLFEYGCLTPTTAKKVPAVRRCVRVLADSIAEMPLGRWKGLEKLPTGTFLEQPEADRAASTSIRQLVEDLIWYPYAYWRVVARDWYGYPAVAERLDPAYVTTTYIPGTSTIDEVYAYYKGERIPKADLIQFAGPDEGVLRLGDVEILTAMRLEMAARTYADPEIPSGVLVNTGEYRLTAPERTELMNEWTLARRQRQTAYLDANLDYRNTMAMPDQLQLVQGREESAAQIARLFNLPAYYASAKSGDSMTYTSVPSQRRDLVDISLAPYISAIEDRLSMNDRNGSPRGQTVRLDREFLLRSDAREDAEVGEILIRSGQSTPNEQRARRGLVPLPGGDAAAVPTPPAAQEDPNAA